MYVDFDECLCYSGITYVIIEKMLMKVFNVIMVILIIQAKYIVLIRKVGQ